MIINDGFFRELKLDIIDQIIKLLNALFVSFNTHLHLQIKDLKYLSTHSAITKANQLSSVPGPADYHAKKPLHQTATIAQTSQARNLYKTFEPNPGPGTY